ncbi:MAG: TIGR01777 family protein [Chitinophagaceae bacterium]|nr:MAG: TIGR01777 family protein [Chitinophagaceae bacterium]
MHNRKIIIAGGTGFIGQELIKFFGNGNDLVILGRQAKNQANNRNHYSDLAADDLLRTRYVQWDGKTAGAWAAELERADLLVNLAGKSVNCRYTEANKQEIMDSRVNANHALGAAIRLCKKPPALWINSSSATIYRHATDHAQDEFTGETGEGFSVDVCKQWEASFYGESTPATRKAALRIAITLGEGGVLIPYFNLLKFKMGGAQGSGKQMYSWVHKDDLCHAIGFIHDHNELDGTFNVAAPNPVPNRDFMTALRKATGHVFGLPAYSWMLKAGAWMIGTETELVLKSRCVIPSRLLQAGFSFRFPYIGPAFEDILKAVPAKQYSWFKR